MKPIFVPILPGIPETELCLKTTKYNQINFWNDYRCGIDYYLLKDDLIKSIIFAK